jgi:uncharacterized Zn finger protein
MDPEDDDPPTPSGPPCPGCSSDHTVESLNNNPDERLFSCTDCGTSWFENSDGDKRILIHTKKP